LIKSIGIILPIFLTTVVIAVAITLTFLSFIVTVQAEIKGISSEKKELLSFILKDNDNGILDQSTIKQEKDTLYENFTIYEGLGIKLENSNNWTILAKSDKSSCESINLCFIEQKLNLFFKLSFQF
jgi:hypothetical protein